MGGAKRPQPKRLPAKLRHIREALGYTQEEMVRHLGLKSKVPRSYLSRFENGEREPSLEILLKYSELAKIWLNALVSDDVDLPDKLPCVRMHEGIKRKH
jgi:transcriptional regulator with XRE-family HTH domain